MGVNFFEQFRLILTMDEDALLGGEAKKRQKAVSQLAGFRSVRGPHLAQHPGPH